MDKIIYVIELKSEEGNLLGVWVGTDGSALCTMPWTKALKFYDRDSAERFRMLISEKKWYFSLKYLEVTEHKETG